MSPHSNMRTQLVPWSLDRYSTFSFAQEIPPPRPTADHSRLNAAITEVAAALASQRGMSERELAISLTESFGVPWFAVWPILRAWVESGLLDCLVDLRWRARFILGREPLLVAYHNAGTLTAALTGLVPVYLRQRFKGVATSLRLEIAERRSPSPEVPSLPCCRAKSVDQLVSLTRELELPEGPMAPRPNPHREFRYAKSCVHTFQSRSTGPFTNAGTGAN